jgi:hypothetical protein
MIGLYGVLTLVGIALTTALAKRRSWHTVSALGGTLLAALAIPTGFSIGIYLALLAVPFLVWAAVQRQRRAPVA